MKRTQNRIAESRLTLPWVASYGAVMGIVAMTRAPQEWEQWLIMALAALTMMALNNVHALIRIYSRAISCSFIALSVMASFLYAHGTAVAAAQLAMTVFYFCLFHAYQNRDASGWVFYAFAALAVGAFFSPIVLLWVPLAWILLATNILAFSLRNFIASLFGLLTPLWFYAAYCLLQQQSVVPTSMMEAWAQLQQGFVWTPLPPHRLPTVVFLGILTAVGSIHFMRTNYKDKIRTRMLYEMLIIMAVAQLAALVALPTHADALMGMLIVTVSPLVGHFVALTNTRFTNIAFFVLIITTLLITLYNIWI